MHIAPPLLFADRSDQMMEKHSKKGEFKEVRSGHPADMHRAQCGYEEWIKGMGVVAQYQERTVYRCHLFKAMTGDTIAVEDPATPRRSSESDENRPF